MKKIKWYYYAIVAVIIIVITGSFIFRNVNKKQIQNDKGNQAKPTEPVIADSKIKIIDLESDSRPYAVMINNISVARKYQSGLQDAYLVYEMIVEGGITRLMAVFKDQNTARIGSVRSSRHYYLDYAIENDAIYVHYGWSPQAASDISTLKVNNINGLYDAAFWREELDVAYEHTAFTSIEKIEEVTKTKGYRDTTTLKPLLTYTSEPVDLSQNKDSKLVNNFKIKYSNSTITSYAYNEQENLYYRSVNGEKHVDYVTKKQYTAKNIIVAFVSNDDLNDSKGRQELNNIGKGDGYYITNGYAVPIIWTKSTRKSQTIYKYKNGEEINVNDGNTYIQISPLNSITFE